jgi:integrase/recombinase XerD
MKVDIPINKLIVDFLDNIEVAESTKNVYKRTLSYYITWLVKTGRNVRGQQTSDIIGYKTYLRKAGRSAATIDCYIASIKTFSSYLLECEYISKDPSKGIKWERDRNGIFIKAALSIDQVYDLLNTVKKDTTIDKRNYAIINLMSFTGLRCVEVTRLNIEDMKRATDRWILQIQRKGSNEKGGSIAVPDEIVKPIIEYWRYRSGELQNDCPVFVNHSHRSNDTRLTPAYISRIVKAALIRSGLNDKKYTAHSLRHTAATLGYYAGSEQWEIGRLLGHKTPSQTEHYIHCLGIESADEGRATMKISDYLRKHKETNRN